MTQCELCGSAGELHRAKIEGTVLTVCTKCSGFGQALQTPEKYSSQHMELSERKSEAIIITPDYATKIKNARNSLGLTQEECAAKMKERASVFQKIENGEIAPSIAMARKIERTLQVTLLLSYTEEPQEKQKDKTHDFTIGDIVHMQK